MNLKKSIALLPIVGVAILAACSNNNSGTANQKADSTGVKTEGVKSEIIVYVNSDSLQKHYNYFVDVKKSLEAKNTLRQQQFEGKGRSFQQEVANAQRAAQGMTQDQQQQLSLQLQKRQQDLGQLQQSLAGQAAKEEQEETEKLYNKITEYLKKYSKDHGYKMVISYSKGNSAILYADESLDVTNDVLKGLNEEYKAEKK
ncbi:OmpH family outer membrane protein [Solitalea sp. MAHUQ-68]|uniref:OmpH family outer membrane protein n=1 Tax=Solitalea agri TaxID=2953739 RepID=A0A9X2F5V7_9SPHI|nr:OmpH family outer membrane protein [Solitalea agri]MCO4294710.1 OmpH family outer membrane protein [Solitalea agri]